MTHALTNPIYFTHILWCWSRTLCSVWIYLSINAFYVSKSGLTMSPSSEAPSLCIKLCSYQSLSHLLLGCATQNWLLPLSWHHALSWHSYCRVDFNWVCNSSAFHMMYCAYKLNKQGDNIQPWRTLFPDLEPVCSMFISNCCFLTCIQISQEAG